MNTYLKECMKNQNDILAQIDNELSHSCGSNKFRHKIIAMFFDLQAQILVLYRINHYLLQKTFLVTVLLYIQHILSGCHIHPNAEIGSRCNLPHPTGIVIGQGVKIGNNVTIFQHVTIGSHGVPDKEPSYPVINDNVTIYAGAIIVGAVRIGEGSVVGAGAVVLSDVPKKAVVVGTPAKLVRTLQ